MQFLLVLLTIAFAVDAQLILSGEKVKYFKDRSIGVNVDFSHLTSKWLRRSFPIMFKNKTINGALYENVVILEDDTDITFKVVAKNYNGFGYSIKSDKGDEIVKNLYTYSCSDCEGAISGANTYEDNSHYINVASADTPEIPSRVAVKYKHIVVTVWRLDSFEGNPVKHFTTGDFIEAIDDSVRIFSRTHSLGSNSRRKRDKVFVTQVKRDKGDQPEPTYEMAMVRPVLHQESFKYQTVRYVEEDRNDILGRIEMDLFILKSKFLYEYQDVITVEKTMKF